ncbi:MULTISPECIES: aminotransferase class V-fold PLP-dependent enzyme [unclassified Tolypothrix]|uniref:aminotransferase class V-fold PLP-dependent enzyme n=1 Tax=unclassified Tolypothrix TaxID=2649714 RepID=UPI0005EAB65D|nr:MULTISPECIES: aminotransferase class V-fold PLP-dependent enzyme [unclassified Tolypothrix]BAY92167.1 isopenicillin-N epimerase [Microchaete diplosiphon NIES-3275]EKE98535.1 aminotransferase, class V [Tolypothrix sp. PCC 7601]MBE9088028.1 aminotransferase class V-fold PLP-dependent enzyme [Tolypothrix sp. LEGE 11397]UYD26142.1 aminotransferase class V-fold PLP-dependent enzyme [Tolypothrix sp. PCC 7712]UYD31619.1 aminotransferase class V-fold PLP-dependent enzyme [Tolypothrix sp. PCC 7601]
MKDEKLSFKLQSSEYANLWTLDPEITFLNHGSFGACPKAVLEVQQKLRSQLEQEPINFFGRAWEPLIDNARSKLADFVGADSEDVVFVNNATTGVNAVLRSLTFTAEDEILTTNHEYNACRNALDFIASRTGVRIVIAKIPFPIESPQQVIAAVMERVSPKTKLALIDHVTSQTGLIFPIQQLIKELQQQGVDTLIDGAHAPGMIALNLREIGAAYYTGNCHKWLCAPKGAAFLYVQPDKQSEIRPLTISHGANSPRTDKSRFQLEFDWTGTDDPTAYMCVPEAIAFMGSLLPGGWDELRQQNHQLVLEARQLLCQSLGVLPPCPESMIGSMAVIPMPNALENRHFMSVHDDLFDKFGIQVQVVPWQESPRLLLRISAQIYNKLEQYAYLAKALSQLAGG